MVDAQIRLLLVEDQPDDAFLLLRKLGQAGYSLRHRCVTSAQELRRVLAEQEFDLVLSDYCLPGFTGLEALEILKESGQDIPFILVSGAVPEEAATVAMENGAADFLEKGRYARLIPAIQRELRESRSRRASSAGSPWELAPGALIGPYRVEERLGEGVSGVVYRVSRPGFQACALKLLKSSELRGLDILPRFQREMQALTCLQHPGIPAFYDVGEFRGLPFLCMELLQPLGIPQSLSQVLEVLGQAAGALAYAHEQGIIHRDVKTANLLRTRNGQVCLTDFGLARALDSNTLTAEGTLLGTPAYVAPEVLCGQPASPASDQYSLGCVAFELLTGRPPYQGESPLAVAVQHIHQPLPDLHPLRPDLPAWLVRVVLKMLAKDPLQRFSSLHDLRLALLPHIPQSLAS